MKFENTHTAFLLSMADIRTNIVTIQATPDKINDPQRLGFLPSQSIANHTYTNAGNSTIAPMKKDR